MIENFGRYNEYIDNIDVKGDQIPDSVNENLIKDKARNYVEKRLQEGISKEDYEELLQNIKTLLERQDVERLNIREELEKQVISETREELDKEALIQEAKTILYEKLGIDENQTKNSRTENFLKGIVDVLVIDNYDLAIEIYETNGKIIIDALKALMSWEGIKQMAEAIGESFMSLFTGNAYEKGKAIGELGLVTTGIGVTAVVGKKAVKVGMREISKLRANKERLVSSAEMKGVIADTNKKIEDIIPKKEVDFDKMLVEDIAKLGDKDRIDAGRFYIQRKLTPEQEKAIIEAHNVGIPNKDGKFDIGDLRKKYIILEKAGFNDNEIRTLMEKGVCGKDKLPSLGKSLLDEPRFRFLNNPEYKELLDLYGGNIDVDKLLGEGQNAIILQHPNKGNRILKVAKEGAKDDIIQEFNNHQTFFTTLERGKIDFPGELSENVRIPEVKKGNGNNPIYFEMEKIDGQSFRSLFYREKYAPQLERVYIKEELAKMSDAKLEGVVKELGLDPIPNIILNFDGGFSRVLFNESQTFMWNRIRDPIKKQEYDLGSTLSFLDWRGLRHTDMHSGNFMLSRDGITTYIIDFGNTNLNIKK